MTLNITVATDTCIYQSADYRLLDLRTDKTFDFDTQKIVFVHTFRWSATVCFAGVGRTATVDVGEWLAERAAAILSEDPFERLLDELLKADEWLSNLRNNRHSFSVGAFVGSEPVFALVSNFEEPSGLARDIASARLSLYQLRPSKPVTFVSGQKGALSRAARRRLAAFAARDPQTDNMYSAMAEAGSRAELAPCQPCLF